jgi:monoamine oxidase
MSATNNRADVVVIGAGLAGLAAARHLVSLGLDDILVIDGRSEPGGKCVQRTIHGHLVDCGAGWTAAAQHHIKELAADVGVATYPTEVHGGQTIRLTNGTVRYLDPEQSGVSGDAQRDLDRIFAELDRLRRQVPPARPWDAEDADELDAVTVDGWIRRQTADAEARAVARHYFDSSVVPPRQMSLLSAVTFVASCGGVAGLETEADELFVGGAAQIPRRVAAEFGGRVLLDWPATEVSWSNRTVTVNGPRGSLEAQRMIVAMSPADARRIAFSPGLSTARELLHKGWVQSSLIKTNVVYDRPFWRAATTDRPAITGWVSSDSGCPRVVLDATPADAQVGVLAAFTYIEGEREPFAIPHGVLDDRAARRRLLLDNLVLMYGPEAAHPVAVQETHWGHEPYVAGCLGAAQPGLLTQCGAALRDPVGPIHWAGAESAEVWINHLSGAVQSGIRAATEVIGALDLTSRTAVGQGAS